jgi:hypothetical protein
VTRAEKLFGFRAAHPLREDIVKTVDWFMQHRHELREVSLAGRG